MLMAEKMKVFDKEAWTPKTQLGAKVKSGEISSLEQVFDRGSRILEPEITDALLPNLEAEMLKLGMTQRVTDSGKRNQFRVVMVVGDHNGHVGLGVGKSVEAKPAMEYAMRNAKKAMISVTKGCGSWECRCQVQHSLPMKTVGKLGSTIVTLKPAPKGLGLAANDTVKKVLGMAGVKDIWSSVQNGGNLYNTAAATINALENLNSAKPKP
jgi:small subunit ribosomal protein S5